MNAKNNFSAADVNAQKRGLILRAGALAFRR
jgi:hypothetical protein